MVSLPMQGVTGQCVHFSVCSSPSPFLSVSQRCRFQALVPAPYSNPCPSPIYRCGRMVESERWREYVETSDVLVGRIGLGLTGRAGSGRREYGLASANRGGASDEKEVAGLNLALADLYQQAAEAADGAAKQQYLAAAAGYLAD